MAESPAPSRAKPAGALNPQTFERLLEHLGDDRARSAQAYEHLRQRLIGLLQWWGAYPPDDLADETLDRMARKLEEGAVIQGSIGAYARGVTRMVFLESMRRPVAQPANLDEVAAPVPDARRETDCFDGCLAALAEHDRTLVLRYYDGVKPKDARRDLAAELGLSMTALRIRVHRLRDRLERCTNACLQGQ